MHAYVVDSVIFMALKYEFEKGNMCDITDIPQIEIECLLLFNGTHILDGEKVSFQEKLVVVVAALLKTIFTSELETWSGLEP